MGVVSGALQGVGGDKKRSVSNDRTRRSCHWRGGGPVTPLNKETQGDPILRASIVCYEPWKRTGVVASNRTNPSSFHSRTVYRVSVVRGTWVDSPGQEGSLSRRRIDGTGTDL